MPDIKRSYVRKKEHNACLAKDKQFFRNDETRDGQTLSRSQLSCQDVRRIIGTVRERKLSYAEAAAIHKVKPAFVQSIMSSLKKDPGFLDIA